MEKDIKKLCTNCKWYEENTVNVIHKTMWGHDLKRCTHPKADRNAVTGECPPATDERLDVNLGWGKHKDNCGSEARHFEPIPV